ncbi:terminal nucleotidyltransferase 5C-like [Corythoichthys intestinalis]|uniref:terminal nucleotidyltransferase 5C-like n=1 Tax=Corythoichthys intestinalis TaxID=161448 RepID=UPI0025A66FA0|nr:terminal nucleotidyltransferase 5C-like [Corythoichthys intestinalis]
MTEPQSEKRFHNLTLEQLQALDKVLTEIIPIHGRGNFPTLQVSAKDIIRVVKDRLVERNIRVKDVRLNGTTASHVLVRDNGLGVRDLDIIFGVELPRQDDFQVIKEAVLGSLRDLLPYGVNRRKITCLTMKEAYVQKMVKVFNEHDRWSLISLSNNKAKTVGLRFVSALRRQFEFSVDSFQIILDRMLESYWENDRKQGRKPSLEAQKLAGEDKEAGNREGEDSPVLQIDPKELSCGGTAHQSESAKEKELPQAETKESEGQVVSEGVLFNLNSEDKEPEANAQSEEDVPFQIGDDKEDFSKVDSSSTCASLKQQLQDEASHSCISVAKSSAQDCVQGESAFSSPRESHHEVFPSPPPPKKTCSTSPEVVPDYCPSPKLQRKMSRKMIRSPEKWSLLTDVSDMTTQMFAPIEIPTQVKHPLQEGAHGTASSHVSSANVSLIRTGHGSDPAAELSVKPERSEKPPDFDAGGNASEADVGPTPAEAPPPGCTLSSWGSSVTVEAECTYGDFEQAVEHLRRRLIATHHPEEIRGGGLLKYCELLVRNFRPASETEIKSFERYMCSRFFIDFPDVKEQRRKMEAYLQGHFTGGEEGSKYDYLMTLRRVIDESTVCLMGHERRQTLNMITVLALRILGEQNAIPNAANVTCFYQPAPYVSEPIYGSYFIAQPTQPSLIYHPYPLHVHMQSGPV